MWMELAAVTGRGSEKCYNGQGKMNFGQGKVREFHFTIRVTCVCLFVKPPGQRIHPKSLAPESQTLIYMVTAPKAYHGSSKCMKT